MDNIESTIFLIIHEKIMELYSCLHSLVQLLTCEHFIEDVACTKDIAFLVILLIKVIVYLLQVNLRGWIYGRAFLEGYLGIGLDGSRYPEISYFYVVVRGDQQVLRLEVSVEEL